LPFFACAAPAFVSVTEPSTSAGSVVVGALPAGVAVAAGGVVVVAVVAGEAGVAPGAAGGVVTAPVLAAGVVAAAGGMYVVVGEGVAVPPGALDPPVAALALPTPRARAQNAIRSARDTGQCYLWPRDARSPGCRR
jgi:hypothetical protein